MALNWALMCVCLTKIPRTPHEHKADFRASLSKSYYQLRSSTKLSLPVPAPLACSVRLVFGLIHFWLQFIVVDRLFFVQAHQFLRSTLQLIYQPKVVLREFLPF